MERAISSMNQISLEGYMSSISRLRGLKNARVGMLSLVSLFRGGKVVRILAMQDSESKFAFVAAFADASRRANHDDAPVELSAVDIHLE